MTITRIALFGLAPLFIAVGVWVAAYFYYSHNPERLRGSGPASDLFIGLAGADLRPIQLEWPTEACSIGNARLSWAWEVVEGGDALLQKHYPIDTSDNRTSYRTSRYSIVGCENVRDFSLLPTATPAVPLSQLDCEAGRQAQARARNSGAPTGLDALLLPEDDPRRLSLLESLNRTPDLPQSLTVDQIQRYREIWGYIWSPEEKLWCVIRR